MAFLSIFFLDIHFVGYVRYGTILLKGGRTMKNRFQGNWQGIVFIVACIFFASSAPAFGAGFGLIEQSVSGLGNAFAGGAASAEDASTIFFNPAGLTHLQDQQLILGAHIIDPSVKFHNENSIHVTGAPLSGGNGGDGGVTKVVPNFYYSRKISDRFSVGLGVNSPFGLATQYDRTWVGRYHAVDSDLITINIAPTIAYKITDQLSFGAGLDIQYMKANLSSAVDFGTIGFSHHIPGLLPQLNDGLVSLEGDSWGVGFNLGLLYEFDKNTRVGIAYRSNIEQDLGGTAHFQNVPAPLQSSFRDDKIKADITLPDSISVSFFHQFNPQWMVMADVTWTDWNHFKDLVVNFNNQPASITTEDWQDGFRCSLGATYLPDKNWTLRVGTAYDRSAVPDKAHRTPRIPDSDRIWAAAGIGYKLSNMFSVDVGYAHIFVNDPEIDKNPTGEDQLRGGLKGSFDAHINIVSASVTMKF